MNRLRRPFSALAVAAVMTLVLAPGAPAGAHETVAPTDCGFDHACSYKHAHYDTKILSPSGGQWIDDFSQLSGVNDQLSSVYNHESGLRYWLFEHKDQGGIGWWWSNNGRRAHFSTLNPDFDNEASSCAWTT